MTFFDFKILKSSLNDIHRISFLLLFAFPLMPFSLVSISTGLFLIMQVFISIYNGGKLYNTKKRIIYFFLFCAYYLVIAVSLFYSDNLSEGLGHLTKQISLFAFPVVLLFFPRESIDEKTNEAAWYVFVSSSLVLAIYILFEFAFNYGSEEMISATFFRKTLGSIKYLDLHPTYVSSYFCISILFLLDKIYQKVTLSNVAATFFFLTVLLSLTSRMCIFSLVVAALVLIFLRGKKNLFWATLLGVFVILALFKVDFVVDRFKVVYESGIEMPDSKHLTSTNLRTGIYRCVYLVLKDDWVFGKGIGDFQTFLNTCYKESYDTTLFQRRHFNSHSNYFYLLGTSGILSVLCFIGLLLWIFYFLIQRKDFFLFASFTFISLVFFTESLLQRAYGLALFNLLLISVLGKVSRILYSPEKMNG